MKKRFRYLMLVCILALLCLGLTSCGAKLEYTATLLTDAQVGINYSVSVATATGADAITYALKDGNKLPAGLSLSSTGVITGTPAAKGSTNFTVTATAGNTSVDADFTIAVAEGVLSYAGGEISVAQGEAVSASVASATGSGSITYALKDGSALPEGLTLAQDGTISGQVNEASDTEVTIVASASDCKEAEANFTIRITAPAIAYEGGTLATARVGEYYTAKLSGNAKATYTLEDDSQLPAGLTFENGLLVGIPEKAGSCEIAVKASAEGYSDTVATFSMSIRGAQEQSDISGTVTFAESKKELTSLYLGTEVYLDGVIRSDAIASNDNHVEYALKDGDTLPEGLTLYPNGTIAGTPTKAGKTKFTVIASAQGCETDKCKYTITISEAKIAYSSMTLEAATVGSEYHASVATAETPEGKPITYSLASGSTMPAGLTLASDGTVSGVPEQYFARTYFYVNAEAEGYTATKATVYLTIYDKPCAVQNGVMEAELTNLDGLQGSGWSGGASGANMIQMFPDASNMRAVGYTYMDGLTFTFRFDSDKQVSDVSLYVSLSSEIGTVTFNPSNLGILLNGTEINYADMTVTGTTNVVSAFKEYTVSSGLTLNEGENVVQLVIRDNLLIGGERIGGPIIDCIRVQTSANLTWQPYSYNIQ